MLAQDAQDESRDNREETAWRDVIAQGAELCGWELDELMERTIAAMQSFAPDRDTFRPEE